MTIQQAVLTAVAGMDDPIAVDIIEALRAHHSAEAVQMTLWDCIADCSLTLGDDRVLRVAQLVDGQAPHMTAVRG